MAFFHTPLAAFFLSLTIIAALSPATAMPPSSSPAAQDPITYNIIPIDEKQKDDRYLTANMIAAVEKVEHFVSDDLGGKLKAAAAEGNYDAACVALCKEMFENAAESMKKGVESVTSGDFVKAAFDVSSFNSDVDACNECTDAFGEFDQWAKGVAVDCLDKIVRHSTPHF